MLHVSCYALAIPHSEFWIADIQTRLGNGRQSTKPRLDRPWFLLIYYGANLKGWTFGVDLENELGTITKRFWYVKVVFVENLRRFHWKLVLDICLILSRCTSGLCCIVTRPYATGMLRSLGTLHYCFCLGEKCTRVWRRPQYIRSIFMNLTWNGVLRIAWAYRTQN